MNAKTWLSRARTIDGEIDGLLQVTAETKERIMTVTQSLNGMPVQSTKDPHKYDRLVELENEIDKRIDQLIAVKTEIEMGISKLTDGRYRKVLRMRYLQNKTFEEISVAIGYSYKQTCRLHGRALLMMEEVLNGQKKSL